ncbi:hypothetical protein [Pseudomonas sp. TWP3-1]|uniref:hypothetical protein n=1 Tax=Pseudomonas sp. TWP3-1 TaxID=2804631 RepID=UPI003CEA3EFC
MTTPSASIPFIVPLKALPSLRFNTPTSSIPIRIFIKELLSLLSFHHYEPTRTSPLSKMTVFNNFLESPIIFYSEQNILNSNHCGPIIGDRKSLGNHWRRIHLIPLFDWRHLSNLKSKQVDKNVIISERASNHQYIPWKHHSSPERDPSKNFWKSIN